MNKDEYNIHTTIEHVMVEFCGFIHLPCYVNIDSTKWNNDKEMQLRHQCGVEVFQSMIQMLLMALTVPILL